MTISEAFASAPLFARDDTAIVGGQFDPARGDSLEDWVDREAGHLVGQEAISLSTTPAFEGDRLVPRPMSLRVFLGRTPNGWQVMPGGLARIGRTGASAELAMQRGGSAADIWVVSAHPVPRITMLEDGQDGSVRQQPSALPSRAADNLFWLGRYVERAENAHSHHPRLQSAARRGVACRHRPARRRRGASVFASGRRPTRVSRRACNPCSTPPPARRRGCATASRPMAGTRSTISGAPCTRCCPSPSRATIWPAP